MCNYGSQCRRTAPQEEQSAQRAGCEQEDYGEAAERFLFRAWARTWTWVSISDLYPGGMKVVAQFLEELGRRMEAKVRKSRVLLSVCCSPARVCRIAIPTRA